MSEIKIYKENNPSFNDWYFKKLEIDSVWEKTKGENIKIAIIDTGIDSKHLDLKDNIKDTFNMKLRNSDATDHYGHGTHVAGLIAGQKTGISPMSDLYIAKILGDDGIGTPKQLLDGIAYAMDNDVDILCMSLGYGGKLPVMFEEVIDKVKKKGITVISSSGNEDARSVGYPAIYPSVISVGGVSKDGKRSNFSNFGKDLDFVAPANNIFSTYLNNEYATMSGTSMSSAIFTGMCALVLSYFKNKGKTLTPNELYDILRSDKDKRLRIGYGMPQINEIII